MADFTISYSALGLAAGWTALSRRPNQKNRFPAKPTVLGCLYGAKSIIGW